MRWRLFGLLVAAAVFPSSAAADRVIVLSPGGHAVVRNDPFLTGPASTPAPSPAETARASLARAGRHRRHKPQKTVRSELARLYHSGQITQPQYGSYSASWNAALRTERHLHGTRAAELTAVTLNMHAIAAAGLLTPSRLPALFLTLERNRQWWSSGPVLGAGQRVEFSGSQLVWEYYPGQGIQLTALANFGKANGMFTAGPAQYAAMRSLLGELIPLAANRGGALTWEYYFTFDGGTPPWTSAMSQGTAIEALARAAQTVGTAGGSYLSLAHQALALFEQPPPVGVAVQTPLGQRYVQYSFAARPSEEVINAFLQSLIGLYQYVQVSQDPQAQALFAAGNAEAQAELPRFDTGAWSLYQPGVEDSLSYHQLVTGFLGQLCSLNIAPVYCTTAQHFQTYLTTPPSLALQTSTLKARKSGQIHFSLSKMSRVGIVVLRGSQTVFATSATFGYGAHWFSLPALKHRGLYTVRLAATDLANNFNRVIGSIQVTR